MKLSILWLAVLLLQLCLGPQFVCGDRGRGRGVGEDRRGRDAGRGRNEWRDESGRGEVRTRRRDDNSDESNEDWSDESYEEGIYDGGYTRRSRTGRNEERRDDFSDESSEEDGYENYGRGRNKRRRGMMEDFSDESFEDSDESDEDGHARWDDGRRRERGWTEGRGQDRWRDREARAGGYDQDVDPRGGGGRGQTFASRSAGEQFGAIPSNACPRFRSHHTRIACLDREGNVKPCTGRTLFGEKVQLQCKPGYSPRTPVHSDVITCEETGVWSAPAFSCYITDPTMIGYTKGLTSGYYKFYQEPKYGRDAERRCTKDGGRLMVLDTPEKKGFAQDVLELLRSRSGPNPSAWGPAMMQGVYVGVGDATQGSPVGAGCPAGPANVPAGQRCVVLTLDSPCLADISCSTRLAFICEIENVPQS